MEIVAESVMQPRNRESRTAESAIFPPSHNIGYFHDFCSAIPTFLPYEIILDFVISS